MELEDIAHKLKAKRCADGYRARCPAHKDKSPSLWFGVREGTLYFQCKTGCSYEDVRAALGIGGEVRFNNLPVEVRDPIVEAARRLKIQNLWDSAVPINLDEETPAAIYLRHTRKVLPRDGQCPSALRQTTSPIKYYNSDGELVGSFFAMLGRIDCPDGSMATVHRTYLSPLGQKAPVDKPKKLMVSPWSGITEGAAIRLYKPVNGVLGVAEGIETALAAQQLFHIPTWAAWSASGIKKFHPPADLKLLVIFADHDKSGIESADDLIERLRNQNVELVAEKKHPQMWGRDWADELLHSLPMENKVVF